MPTPCEQQGRKHRLLLLDRDASSAETLLALLLPYPKIPSFKLSTLLGADAATARSKSPGVRGMGSKPSRTRGPLHYRRDTEISESNVYLSEITAPKPGIKPL